MKVYTPLVQLAERRFPKPNVEGSSPSRRVFCLLQFFLHDHILLLEKY